MINGKNVEITINDKKMSVPEGITILDAAKTANIDIPTLCYHPDQKIKANCRVCIVEVEGAKTLSTACSTPVTAGMVIRTNSIRVLKARKTIIKLLLANHDADCLKYPRNQACELQKIAAKAGIRTCRFESVLEKKPPDIGNFPIVRDPNRYIKCGRCVEVCKDVQGVNTEGKKNAGDIQCREGYTAAEIP